MNGHAINGGDDDLLKILQSAHPSNPLEQMGLAAAAEHAAADIRIILAQRQLNFVQADIEFEQALQVDAHLKLLLMPAPGVDLGDPWHAEHLRANDPDRKSVV